MSAALSVVSLGCFCSAMTAPCLQKQNPPKISQNNTILQTEVLVLRIQIKKWTNSHRNIVRQRIASKENNTENT